MWTYLLTILRLRATTPAQQPSARRTALATLRGADRRAYYWCNGR